MSKLFDEAKRFLVGGVNSPARAFKAVGVEPVFIRQAKGSRLYSEGSRVFIDYCMSWGASILGHSHPEVLKALKEALEGATSFGAATKKEIELARLIIKAIPSIEKLRFTNSGTEAVAAAMKLARAYTKKNKFIRFAGSYHGWLDYISYISEYNNLEKTEALLKRHNNDVAAIIVEPVGANCGVMKPEKGFLTGLSRLSDKFGALLIFDEVVTGFRLTFAGAQDLFGVRPDLTCLGKIIGGGLPVGAVGGRNNIMKLLAPEGDVYQAGTFSGNPLTTTAGITTLKILKSENPYPAMEIRAGRICEALGPEANFVGSMFSAPFDKELFKKIYNRLLEEGVYFSPSAKEANFVSSAHTDKDIEKTVNAIKRAMEN